jgi:acetyltransferase
MASVERSRAPQYARRFRSRRNHAVLIRSLSASDSDALAMFLGKLSPETIYRRYFMALPSFSPEAARREIARLLRVQSHYHTLVAVLDDTSPEPIVVGVAELARTSPHTTGEVAVVVADAYQAEGIGSALCTELGDLAASHGIATIEAAVLTENPLVQRLVRHLGLEYTTTILDGVTTIQIPIARAL